MQDIKFIEVKGNCMVPVLYEKTVVPYKPAGFSDILPEDIVVLKIKGVYMIHRVIDKFQIKGRRFFIHKGDAAKIPLLAPACALAGKAIVEQTYCKVNFILIFKIVLIKFKLWLRQLLKKA